MECSYTRFRLRIDFAYRPDGRCERCAHRFRLGKGQPLGTGSGERPTPCGASAISLRRFGICARSTTPRRSCESHVRDGYSCSLPIVGRACVSFFLAFPETPRNSVRLVPARPTQRLDRPPSDFLTSPALVAGRRAERDLSGRSSRRVDSSGGRRAVECDSPELAA